MALASAFRGSWPRDGSQELRVTNSCSEAHVPAVAAKSRFSRRQLGVGGVLLACLLLLLLITVLWQPEGGQTQRLDDGTLLVLTRAKFGPTNEFIHGSGLEKILRRLIPFKGVQIAGFKLERPATESFAMLGKPWLTAEFKLIPASADTLPPMADRSLSRRFRCVVGGETGIEYAQYFYPGAFRKYRDGYFGYILGSRFPRDSESLSFRVEQRETQDGPWCAIASFGLKNPTHPADQPWRAEATPSVKTVQGMEFTLGEVTLETKPLNERDMWNHTVSVPLRVRTNGVTLTNWSAARIEGEDASGNWGLDAIAGAFTNDWNVHRGSQGLDPRYVWKLEIDFSPASQFARESLHEFPVPVALSRPILTNCAGIPLEISWVNQNMLSVQMLTNREDLRLVFVAAIDRQGRDLDDWVGSWHRTGFWKGLKLERTNQSVEATIAIVPNVHVTYFVQPKLVGGATQREIAR